MQPKLKILSIDGGGIRGIIPCRILQFIEEELKKPISEIFDVIAGTSTGGIITLGLNINKPEEERPYLAKEMGELYYKEGQYIFARRKRDWISKLLSILPLTRQLSAQPYEHQNIEALLERYFGERKLSEIKRDVLVTTYDIINSKTFYFSSRLAKNPEHPHEDFLLREVARSTSAAPTFFEPNVLSIQNQQKMAFVDGGVFANNPSILAYIEAKVRWDEERSRTLFPVVEANDEDFPFFLLSIGTGTAPVSIPAEAARSWRTMQWIEPMLNRVFMQSVSENTHYIIQHLLPSYTDGTPRYQRFNLQLDPAMAEMDNASPENVKALKALADRYVEEHADQLREVCKLLG